MITIPENVDITKEKKYTYVKCDKGRRRQNQRHEKNRPQGVNSSVPSPATNHVKVNKNWYNQKAKYDFNEDNRVYITNRITPAGSHVNDNTRKVIVVHTSNHLGETKYHVKTDNEVKT